MWIVFGIKFKKVFSTEKIIQRTRDSLNGMLIEINRNAERNITLIDERISKLKAVSSEADRHVLAMEKELEKMRNSIVVQKYLDDTTPSIKIEDQVHEEAIAERNSYYHKNSAMNYIKEQKSAQKRKIDSSVKAPDEVIYKPSLEFQKIKEEEKRASLEKKIPEFITSANPVVPKKSVNFMIKELYDRGETPESIAISLGISVQEVNFSLEFSND